MAILSRCPGRRTFAAILACTACIMILVAAVEPAAAQIESPGEYQVKAAFLYNFAKFVEWPVSAFPNETAPFVIGVLGEDPFGKELDRITEGRIVQGRSIIVRRFQDTSDLAACQILFICSSERPRLKDIFKALERANVLTVGEMDGFAQSGGGINFFLLENKIRFEINTAAAELSGLKVSSKLLSLARIVKKNEEL
jgi:hypothetical protein